MVSGKGDPLLSDQPFPTLRYDRVCRTAHSEAYLLSEGEDPLGRVDLHFGSSIVHGLLVVERPLEEEQLQELVRRLDEDLVVTADYPRDDFVVTVYRGHELGVYSDSPDENHIPPAGD